MHLLPRLVHCLLDKSSTRGDHQSGHKMEIIAEREREGETEAFPSTKIKALACVLIDWTYLRAIACRAWGFLLRHRGPSDFSQRSAVNKQFREVSIYKCIPARKPKATPISVFSNYCVRNRLTSQFNIFCREKWNSWSDYNRNTVRLLSLNPLMRWISFFANWKIPDSKIVPNCRLPECHYSTIILSLGDIYRVLYNQVFWNTRSFVSTPKFGEI